MSVVKAFFERLKAIGPEVGAELSRLGTQGSSELASGLFLGHGFVLYGPGQLPSRPEPGLGAAPPEPAAPEPQAGPERERGGREM